MIWYTVLGSAPHCILVNPDLNVALLKDAIKAKKPSMAQVDSDVITIYLSKQHFKDNPEQALDPRDDIQTIIDRNPGIGNGHAPLFVEYKPPPQPASSSSDHQVTVEILQQLKNLEAAIVKVEQSNQPLRDAVFGLHAGTVRTDETQRSVAEACCGHHRLRGCLILYSLIGQETAEWYRGEACTAHIYDRRKKQEASLLGFGVDDPQNWPMLKWSLTEDDL